jgi:hypothetical protein
VLLRLVVVMLWLRLPVLVLLRRRMVVAVVAALLGHRQGRHDQRGGDQRAGEVLEAVHESSLLEECEGHLGRTPSAAA